jgi:hypothetical protein
MTTITLLDQFIISNKDGSKTAQELFEVHGLDYLYDTIYKEPIKTRGETTRYLFIIRLFPQQKGLPPAFQNRWNVIENQMYKKRGWAERRFKKNKDHILIFGGHVRP